MMNEFVTFIQPQKKLEVKSNYLTESYDRQKNEKYHDGLVTFT